MDILNLPRWTVLHVDEGGQDIRIMAEREDLPTHCPRCGVVFNAVGFGTSEPVYLDQPLSNAKRSAANPLRRV